MGRLWLRERFKNWSLRNKNIWLCAMTSTRYYNLSISISSDCSYARFSFIVSVCVQFSLFNKYIYRHYHDVAFRWLFIAHEIKKNWLREWSVNFCNQQTFNIESFNQCEKVKKINFFLLFKLNWNCVSTCLVYISMFLSTVALYRFFKLFCLRLY